MTEDILISVRGIHSMESGEDDEIEVTSSGKHYVRNGTHYVLYDEVDAETKAVTKNRLKFSDGFLEIRKKGAQNSSMTFQKGEKHTSLYGTPFGQVMVGVEVRDMAFQEQDDQISMDIGYALEMNYEPVADSRIHVKIMEKDRGLFRLK